MKNLISLVLHLALGLALIPANDTFAGNIIVGNGGEGVIEGDQVFLRDLWEVNLHKAPVIGNEIDPELQRRLKSSRIAQLPVSLEILARKLTDLDRLYPLLGRMTIDSINYYNWTLSAGMNLLSQEESKREDVETVYIPKDRLVALANRFQASIRIAQEQWFRLNPENQVALILHEALYGMLQPERHPSSGFFQSSLKIREIVSHAFSGSQGTHYKLNGQMAMDLGLPGFKPLPLCTELTPKIQLLSKSPQQDEFQLISELKHSDISPVRNFYFRSFCQSRSSFNDPRGTIYQMRMYADPYEIKGSSYTRSLSEYGYPSTSYSQYYVLFFPLPGFEYLLLKSSFPLMDTNSCVEYLKEEAQNWIDQKNRPRRTPVNLCGPRNSSPEDTKIINSGISDEEPGDALTCKKTGSLIRNWVLREKEDFMSAMKSGGLCGRAAGVDYLCCSNQAKWEIVSKSTAECRCL